MSHPHAQLQPYDGPIFPIPLPHDDDLTDEYEPGADSYPIVTWVTIDGVVAPCTPPQLATGQPVILDGLSFGWGRDTSVDQPGANTCTFTIREELHFRQEDINQVEDPTFSDDALNASRFPPEFDIEGGIVTIAPDAGIPNLAFDPSFADPDYISPGGGSQVQVGGSTNNIPVLYGDTALAVSQNASGTDTTQLYPTAYVGNNGTTSPYNRPIPLEVGKTYNASVYVQAPSGGTTTNANALKLNLIHLANDGTQNAAWGLSEPATPDGTWQRLSIVFTVPEDTAKIQFRLIVNYIGADPITLGKIKVAWDGLQVTEGPELREYRDSSTATAVNADSYRVWLIGDRMASKVTTAPAGTAPDNGAMPVIPGQTLHMGLTVSASINNREIRWQVARYAEDGTIITSASYVASNTPVPGPNQSMRFEADYVIPADTFYVAVAFVPEGTFGGSVTFSDPEISFTGGQTALDVIHVGSQVEIWSQAWVPPYDAEVYDSSLWRRNGTGELDVKYWTVVDGDHPDTNIHLGRTTATGSDPTYMQLSMTDDYDWFTEIALAPSAFDTTGENPTAWDLLPRISTGLTWHASITVQVPPQTTATLKAYAYSGPEKTDRVGEIPLTGATVTGSTDQMTDGMEWLTIEADVTLPSTMTDPAGYFVVLGIRIEPMASPLTWNDPAIAELAWRDIALRWVDLNIAKVGQPSLEQSQAALRSVLVWAGEVTAAIAQAAGDDAYTVNITASDLVSVLSNVKVGDEPWPSQSLQARTNAIMALIPESPPLLIDDTLEATIVSYRDVDSQAPLGLLQDLAQSAGGVLWITAHATEGAYLWMEDPRNREAVRRFIIEADGTVSIQNEGDAAEASITTISAMDVLRDPVNWVQDVSQVITQVSVTWMEQIPPAEAGGETTTADHTVIVRDTADVVALYGVRDLSVGTELTTEADAMELAARLLALSRGVNWRADGLEYDTILLVRDIDTVDFPARLTTALDLLDATVRIGYAFTMVDMPEWTPAGAVRSMYVEGGTYTWENGRWRLALIATPSQGQGISARWQDFEGTGVTWEDFRPNKIKWIDAYGTSGPVAALAAAPEEEPADA
jgi:hypothetical protein